MEHPAGIISKENRLYMNKYLLFCYAFIVAVSCKQKAASSQKTTAAVAGGGCEGCEAVYETPVPFSQLSFTDTLPGFFEPGPKLMVEGTIYKADGKTPATGVVLYVYHTGLNGLYQGRNGDTGWARRHGYHRGWVKTNEQGTYRFYTCKPAPYPNSNIPAHIHPVVKEPGLNEYYIDEFVFDDDPLLTQKERAKPENRGGSGILKTVNENGMLVAKRDIVLGKNIPHYPKEK